MNHNLSSAFFFPWRYRLWRTLARWAAAAGSLSRLHQTVLGVISISLVVKLKFWTRHQLNYDWWKLNWINFNLLLTVLANSKVLLAAEVNKNMLNKKWKQDNKANTYNQCEHFLLCRKCPREGHCFRQKIYKNLQVLFAAMTHLAERRHLGVLLTLKVDTRIAIVFIIEWEFTDTAVFCV
jgi:hypothetical protein